MIRLSDDIVTLSVGQQVVIDLSDTQDAESAQWSVDNAEVAYVSQDGTIHAAGVGSTTVTVTAGGRASDVVVSVLPSSDELAEADR